MQKKQPDRSFNAPLSRCSPGPVAHEAYVSIECFMADTCGSVARVVRRLGVHECDADDVAQRVYVTFAARLDRIRPGRERAFLFAIAAREAGHQRRSYQRRREQPDDEIEQLATSSARPDVLVQRKETHCKVRAALASMDEALRHVLVSFELEHMSLVEIAQASRLPLGTVKSRLRRARLWFAEELQKYSEGF